ncbi:MAG: hypothetical protein HZC01_00460 [Candidatus Kerfeldbacteria bacterium]|nr:hypothetical protein [Candidatus Kerfeldbacteria bacterium]
MIKRYTPKRIGQVWLLHRKFKMWLQVELAVIKARELRGEYPVGTHQRIKDAARFTAREIEQREKEIEHDLQAFVDVVRQYLPVELQGKFHELVTSYDTEDPAMALLLRLALKEITRDLDALIDATCHQASAHQWTYCMGITHGQDGQVITYAARLLVYLDGLRQSRESLQFVGSQLEMTKCSGAMGTYGSLTPELEADILKLLGLRVRPAASQIVLRDSMARLLSEIAILGGVLEKMAMDNYILGQTAYREVLEPRKKKQKGSSAMPHKKNTIMNERERGMPRALRGYAHAAMENIATPLERDISQSSVERIILPDSTILISYMLQLMTKIVSGMEVQRDRMAKGIQRTFGCWASEQVKTVLCEQLCTPEHGFTADDVYYFVQGCAFKAMEEERDLGYALRQSLFPRSDAEGARLLRDMIPVGCLDPCFDFKKALQQNMPVVYQRNGLDLTAALEPNC